MSETNLQFGAVFRIIVLWSLSLLLGACDGYHPQALEQASTQESTTVNEGVSVDGAFLHSINSGMQVCNTSISQDTLNYPGSMLWLGFSGELIVNNPPDAYNTTGVLQHDRLNISDINNEIQWYMHLDELPNHNCEFQDPEWSTHPDYITSLAAYNSENACGRSMTHQAMLIRLVDKEYILLKEEIDATSTPHVWIAPGVREGEDLADAVELAEVDEFKNGLANKEFVKRFLGSDQLRFTYSEQINGSLQIHFVDFSQDTPNEIALAKPEGWEEANCESALISPDGRWIVFNAYKNIFQYRAYVQELKTGSEPILLAEGGQDPHWFVHPDNPAQWYVQFVTRPEGKPYKVSEDYAQASVMEEETAGATWRVALDLSLAENRQTPDSADWVQIAPLPFKGGRSPDGKYMATGTNYAWLWEFK
jgi:hypothetical protein